MKLYTCTDTDRQTLDTARKTLARWEEVHPSWGAYFPPEWFEQELVLTLTADRSQCYRHCWIDKLDRLVEFEYKDGELSSVEIDGYLVWDAFLEWQHPVHRLSYEFETNTIVSDIEAAYRLNLNPLPEFRRVLGDEFIVKFGIDTGDTAFPADNQKDTLVIWMLDDGLSVRWEWIPAEPSPRKKLTGVVVIPDGWPWNE